MASPFACSVCNMLFVAKKELKAHLNETSPSCKTARKKPLAHAASFNPSAPPITVYSSENARLLAEMEATMKTKTSGLETSILSNVADNDGELLEAYRKSPLINPETKKREINQEIVRIATSKAKINAQRMSEVLIRAQTLSICFLLDTTGSMSKYISGVKEQIIGIVQRVKASGCKIEEIAFIGNYYSNKPNIDKGLIFFKIFTFRLQGLV